MNLLEVWPLIKKEDARGGYHVESDCSRIREWGESWGCKRGGIGPAENIMRFRLVGGNQRSGQSNLSANISETLSTQHPQRVVAVPQKKAKRGRSIDQSRSEEVGSEEKNENPRVCGLVAQEPKSLAGPWHCLACRVQYGLLSTCQVFLTP